MFHLLFSHVVWIISYNYSILPWEEIHRHGRHVSEILKYKFYECVRHVAGGISTDGIKVLA